MDHSRRKFLSLSAGATLATVTSTGILSPERADAGPFLAKQLPNALGATSPIIEVAPLAGRRADDWPRLKKLMDAYAYKASIVLKAGTWRCKSKQSIPSGTVLIGSPGVRIVQQLEYTGLDPFNAAFSAGAQFAETPQRSSLVEDAAIGGNTILSQASFAVNQIVRLSRGDHGLSQHYYSVISVEGAGPFVVTLDRAIRTDFLAGDAIEAVLDLPRDIHIIGNGMTISGTGDRYLELAAAQRCSIQGLNADTSAGTLGVGSPAMALDIGCCECHFSNCSVESKASEINGGIIVESGERCSISNCTAAHAGRTGFALYDCTSSTIVDCHAFGCYYGAYVATDGIMVGCRDCSIRGGTYWNNQHGIIIGASQRTKVSDVDCSHNRENGIFLATYEKDCLLHNISCVGNAAHGVMVNSDAFPVHGSNWTLRDNKAFDIRFDASGTVSNVSCTPCSLNSILVQAGSVSISDLQINHTLYPSEVSVYVEAGAHLRLSRARIDIGTSQVNAIAAFGGGSTISLTDVVVSGPEARGYYGLSNTTLRRAGSNELQTILLADGSAHADSGTLQILSDSASEVPYRDIKATDTVLLALLQADGTPGHIPSVSILPGVGFSVHPQAGDRSQYAWRIVA